MPKRALCYPNIYLTVSSMEVLLAVQYTSTKHSMMSCWNVAFYNNSAMMRDISSDNSLSFEKKVLQMMNLGRISMLNCREMVYKEIL